MKRKLWHTNFLIVLVPMTIAVIVLGLFIFSLISRFLRTDINNNNENALSGAAYNLDLILRDVDLFHHSFSTSPTVIARTKEILRSDSFNYEMQQSVPFITNYINTPVNTQDYLYSAYVYYFGYEKMIASELGVVEKERFFDKDWQLYMEGYTGEDDIWAVTRSIRRYPFEKSSKEILSINCMLHTPGVSENDGVITLNLDKEYLEDMLSNLTNMPGQVLLVLGDDGQIYLSSAGGADSIAQAVREFISDSKTRMTRRISQTQYYMSKTGLPRYGLRIVSVSPQEIRVISSAMAATAIGLILLIIAVSVAIAWQFTNSRKRQIMQIIDILDKYETQGVVAESSSEPRNEYEQISQNILQIFLRNNDMKRQLAERNYQAQVFELRSLQSQINPHFLFNTLETINWKAMELSGGYNTVNLMVENLSRIMQYCLSDPGSMVTLKEEIEYTKCYLAIQQIRHQNKYRMFWEYDGDVTGAEVPKLFIQPLLENCFKHGIQEKEGTGQIKVKIRRKGELLSVCVLDNGAGIPPQRLSELRSRMEEGSAPDEHIGLLNTNKRLRLIYGDSYHIHLYSKYGLCTIITIEIPFSCRKA